MPMDIPGFYYDAEKKKYFKIVSNSNNSDSKYSSSSLKHKRDEIELKQKISKLKIQQSKKSILPFDYILGLNSKFKFNTIDSKISNYYNYRLSNLEFNHDSIELNSNVHQTSLSVPPIKKILKNNNDLIICRDSYTHIYDFSEIKKYNKIDSYIDFFEDNLDNSILRNVEVLNNDLLIKTFCGLLNKPSIVKIFEGSDLKFSSYFDNQLINNSKLIDLRILTCGDKFLHVIDLNRYDVIDSIKSKGDSLCFDFNKNLNNNFPNEIYLGYRNSVIKIWDTRIKKFSHNSKLNNNSIININKINQYDLIISTIGNLHSNSLNLFDIRMNFRKPKLKYETNKIISNIFDEELILNNNEFFTLQNSNLIEIFDINKNLPVKTISKFNLSNDKNSKFSGIYFDNLNLELYTTFNDNLMIYR